MGNENGEWIMHGVADNDPRRIKSPEELTAFVDEIGFLPLFKNSVDGFSVEERTAARFWWSDDAANDPWEWRKVLASEGKVAYGKFFGGKAGFISLRWLPYFANFRRDGYDFDSRWSDGLANARENSIMELFEHSRELYSFEIKRLAGFGKGGAKNFEGTLTALQDKLYLVVRDFRQRINREGVPYGWGIAVYATPESVWGRDAVASAYGEAPEKSRERVFAHLRELFPNATEKQIRDILK